jgi:hypothetical protein
MQKVLNTAAPLASLALFVSVAAPSKATMVVLGTCGLALLYFCAPLGYLAMLKSRYFRPRKRPKLVRLFLWALIVTYPLAGIYSILSGDWSYDKMSTFGLAQVGGLLGLAAILGGVLWVSSDMRRRSYRECPHCLSRIRREATRCRYCTGELGPTAITMKLVERRPQRATSSAVFDQPLPRYLEKGRKKKDFGQLSAPRVTGTMTRGRTRPSKRQPA